MYRDLKSENVLLTGGFSSPAAGWPVLADFGLANFSRNDHNLTTFCGTAAFIAPEVAASAGYGTAADWWSLGILICQCLTLTTPFEGANPKATIDNVLHGRRVGGPALELERAAADLGDGDPMGGGGGGGGGEGGGEQGGGGGGEDGEISHRAAKMIDALLQPDPAERLGGPLRGGEVRVQPFFWGFDWASIERRQRAPPHADVCRERAVAATMHPSLQLPPLPKVRTRRPSVEEPTVEPRHEAAERAALVVEKAASPPVARVPATTPSVESVVSMQQAENFLGEEEDLADFI